MIGKGKYGYLVIGVIPSTRDKFKEVWAMLLTEDLDWIENYHKKNVTKLEAKESIFSIINDSYKNFNLVNLIACNVKTIEDLIDFDVLKFRSVMNVDILAKYYDIDLNAELKDKSLADQCSFILTLVCNFYEESAG